MQASKPNSSSTHLHFFRPTGRCPPRQAKRLGDLTDIAADRPAAARHQHGFTRDRCRPDDQPMVGVLLRECRKQTSGSTVAALGSFSRHFRASAATKVDASRLGRDDIAHGQTVRLLLSDTSQIAIGRHGSHRVYRRRGRWPPFNPRARLPVDGPFRITLRAAPAPSPPRAYRWWSCFEMPQLSAIRWAASAINICVLVILIGPLDY